MTEILKYTRGYATKLSNTKKNIERDVTNTRVLPKHDNFVMSYGVACIRRNSNTGCYEILMIKKRNTYAFIEFVRGMYDPYKDCDLQYMFNLMSIVEKSLIHTRDFVTIWNYCNGTPTKNTERSVFTRSLKKYTTLVGREDDMLLNLVSNTTNATLLWEIPKGRPNKNKETPIISATREFEEETGLKKEQYRILFDEGTMEYTFIDCGVKYKYIYYLAIIDSNTQITYNYNNYHMLWEVSELRFMSAVAIQEMNNNRLAKIARIMIKKAKKYL